MRLYVLSSFLSTMVFVNQGTPAPYLVSQASRATGIPKKCQNDLSFGEPGIGVATD